MSNFSGQNNDVYHRFKESSMFTNNKEKIDQIINTKIHKQFSKLGF